MPAAVLVLAVVLVMVAMGLTWLGEEDSRADREPTSSGTSTGPAKTQGATPGPSRPRTTRPPSGAPTSGQPVVPPLSSTVFQTSLTAAADAAVELGYRTSISVADTATGEVLLAGDDGLFATESVIKELIAVQLLLDGAMVDETAEAAFEMITASNDGLADQLYGLAGGDALMMSLGEHYGIDIGEPPPWEDGWWSANLITAEGLALLNTAVRNDPVVWPWLSTAMHAAQEYGADGTYQYFGLGEATDGAAAIKQGWGADRDPAIASYNSTGFVTLPGNGDDRYSVVILTECPAEDYLSGCPAAVTLQANILLGNPR